jgi:acetyl-CoA carboxylase carboxyl transferase subunit beta
LLDLVLDPDSYESWDTAPVEVVADPDYQAALVRARERTGVDESVLTGVGTIRGRRVAVVACEFGFLAGSIGVAAAERLVTAVERATAERLPLLAAPVSGGTRMQEGTVAFLQMVKISAAIAAHKAAGLPYLVYLRHPTTGGVFASWGSLGHVTAAEPGALIGFLGPRVYEQLYGEPFPPGVQLAEHLFEYGIVDAVLPPEQIAEIADRALRVLCDRPAARPSAPPAEEPVADVPAWESITRSRDPRRPGVRALLKVAADDAIPLNGTGEGEAEPGLLLALARFGDAPCVLLGHDRRSQPGADRLDTGDPGRDRAASEVPGPERAVFDHRGKSHPAGAGETGSAGRRDHSGKAALREGAGQLAGRLIGPGALRQARRGMRLAAELRLPLVTVIDTPGAALSVEAEEGGMAGEIARCLAELVTLDAPTLCLLLGQGSGGGALALLPADRVVAAQHGWLSPLPPEGASAIVHRTTDRAAEMAAAQGVRSIDLRRNGIVDRIVAEHPDAADEPEAFCRRVGTVLSDELAALTRQPAPVRHAARLTRYRHLGQP